MGSSPAISSQKQQPVGSKESHDGFAVLDYIGFKLDFATPKGVEGRFTVSDRSCQPFGVLHGGISAFLAEALASMGAEIASNWKRIAGIELTIHHLRAIRLGQEVVVTATPLMMGKRLQVWDVKLSAMERQGDTANSSLDQPSAVARVSLIIGLPSDGSHAKERLQVASFSNGWLGLRTGGHLNKVGTSASAIVSIILAFEVYKDHESIISCRERHEDFTRSSFIRARFDQKIYIPF